jgi:hypothetical protein
MVIQITGKLSLEVVFIPDDDMIEKFSSDAADHALNVRILPR